MTDFSPFHVTLLINVCGTGECFTHVQPISVHPFTCVALVSSFVWIESNAAVTPSLKSSSRKSHVKQFLRNWVGRGYLVAVTWSTWLLRGLRPALFPRKWPCAALTGQIYVKVWPWHNNILSFSRFLFPVLSVNRWFLLNSSVVLEAGVGVDNQKLSSNFNPHLLSIWQSHRVKVRAYTFCFYVLLNQ